MGHVKLKHVVIYGLIAIAIVSIVLSFVRSNSSSAANALAFSEVVQAGRNGRVDSIDVTGQALSIKMKGDGTVYHARIGKDTDLARILIDSGVTVGGALGVTVRYHGSGGSGVGGWVFSYLPILIFAVVLGLRLFALPLWKKTRVEDRTKPPPETTS